MPWIYLIIAGILEIGWASGLKYTNGFTRLWPGVMTLGLMGVSFWLLTRSAQEQTGGNVARDCGTM